VSSPRRIGLPQTIRMRHEAHYVDSLGHPKGEPIGRIVPIEDLEPNPGQPRRSTGDLSELIASIREKGVLEPILIRPKGARYQIIAGERRYRAAVEAGLAEVPCVVRDASDAEAMELALIENLQRRDLSPFEEASGLKALAERFGYTHETMAERIGKSRSSITEVLTLNSMPEDVRELCRLADISSKSLLLQIVRQSTPERMIALLERLQKEGTTREAARRAAKEDPRRAKKGRPRNFVFRYAPREKSFSLSMQFKRSQVPRDEIIRVLQQVIEELSREAS
jgi:ParB family transcriptional regulator, chromosome partitioning protein